MPDIKDGLYQYSPPVTEEISGTITVMPQVYISGATPLPISSIQSTVNTHVTNLPDGYIVSGGNIAITGWTAGTLPVSVESIASMVGNYQQVKLFDSAGNINSSTAPLYISQINNPSAIAISGNSTGTPVYVSGTVGINNLPSGFGLLDPSGKSYSVTNPLPTEIITDGFTILDANGIAVGSGNPLAVYNPTGTVVSNTTGSPANVKVITSGLPIYNATSGIHVQLYDDSNLSYGLYNPFPVEIINEGVRLLDSSGSAYGSGNPLPVYGSVNVSNNPTGFVIKGSEIVIPVSLPTSGVNIANQVIVSGYTGASIPSYITSFPSTGITVANTPTGITIKGSEAKLPINVYDSLGNQYGVNNLFPVGVLSGSIKILDSSGNAISSANPLNVTTNLVTGVAITGITTTIPTTVTTSSGSPLWVNVVTGSAGIPIINGNSSLFVRLKDENNAEYTLDNPLPAILSDGVVIHSLEGPVSNSSPLPVSLSSGYVTISGWASGVIPHVIVDSVPTGLITKLVDPSGNYFNSGNPIPALITNQNPNVIVSGWNAGTINTSVVTLPSTGIPIRSSEGIVGSGNPLPVRIDSGNVTVSGWSSSVIPHVVIDSIPAHPVSVTSFPTTGVNVAGYTGSAIPVTLASTVITSGNNLNITSLPSTGIAISSIPSGLISKLIDPSGSYYSSINPIPAGIVSGKITVVDASGIAFTENNPVPVEIITDGISLLDSSGIAIDRTNPMQVILPSTGTIISNPVTGITIIGHNVTTPISGSVTVSAIPTGLSTILYDSTGSVYSSSNPIPTIVTNPTVFPSTGIPVITATTGFHVQLFDDANLAYGLYNPIPVEIISEGIRILDSSGTSISPTNPLPVTSIVSTLPASGINIANNVVVSGYTGSPVPAVITSGANLNIVSLPSTGIAVSSVPTGLITKLIDSGNNYYSSGNPVPIKAWSGIYITDALGNSITSANPFNSKITNFPSGFYSTLIDSTGSVYTVSNPLAVKVTNSSQGVIVTGSTITLPVSVPTGLSVILYDSTGSAITASNSLPTKVTSLPGVTVTSYTGSNVPVTVSNVPTGITIKSSESTIPVSATFISGNYGQVKVFDSAGNSITSGNAFPVLVTNPSTITTSSGNPLWVTPVTGTNGIPITNGTSALNVKLKDELGNDYTLDNPIPIIAPNPILIQDIEGPISTDNPMPVSVSNLINIPGVMVTGWTGGVIPHVQIDTLPATGVIVSGTVSVNLPSTTITSADNVKITSLPTTGVNVANAMTVSGWYAGVVPHVIIDASANIPVTMASTVVTSGSNLNVASLPATGVNINSFPATGVNIANSIAVNSVPTGIITKLVDSTGSPYTSTNPINVKVSNPSTGIVVTSGVISVNNATSGLHVQLFDDYNVTYSSTNPFPTKVVSGSVSVSSLPSTGIVISSGSAIVPIVASGGSLSVTTSSGNPLWVSVTTGSAGIPITNGNSGLYVRLKDSLGNEYASGNPLPVSIPNGSISISNFPVLPTGTSVTGWTSGVVAHVAIDSSVNLPVTLGSTVISSGNNLNIVSLPATGININSLPATGINIAGTGLPVYNATTGLHVQLFDSTNLAYDLYNPVPVEVVSEGIRVLDSSGVAISDINPLAVKSTIVGFPATGVTVAAYSGSTIPVSLSTLPSGNVSVISLPSTGVAISSIPTGLVTKLIDSTNTYYSSGNPVPIKSYGGVYLNDSTGTAITPTNPLVVKVTNPVSGVSVSNFPTGITLLGSTSAIPVSVPTGMSTILYDATGSAYTNNNPLAIKVTNPVTGVTSILADASGNYYTENNPIAVEIISDGISLLDASGVPVDYSNPLPALLPSGVNVNNFPTGIVVTSYPSASVGLTLEAIKALSGVTITGWTTSSVPHVIVDSQSGTGNVTVVNVPTVNLSAGTLATLGSTNVSGWASNVTGNVKVLNPISVSTVPTGLSVILYDSTGSPYTINNPLTVKVTNPTTGTVVASGIISVNNATSGLHVSLYDDSNAVYSQSNPFPTKIVSSTPLTISALPSTGIVISGATNAIPVVASGGSLSVTTSSGSPLWTSLVTGTAGIPITNGTQGLFVRFRDENSNEYTVDNPMPVAVNNGVVIHTQDGPVTSLNPVPVSLPNGTVTVSALPDSASGVTIKGWDSGVVSHTIVDGTVTVGTHAVTLASTTLTSADNVKVTSLPQVVISGSSSTLPVSLTSTTITSADNVKITTLPQVVISGTASTLPVSLSSVPSHAVTLASTTLTSADNVKITSLPQVVISGAASTLPVSLASVPSHAVTLASTTISTGSIFVTNIPTGIAVTSVPTGLITKLVDSSGAYYSSGNPVPVNVWNYPSGFSLLDSSGTSFTENNPVPVEIISDGISLLDSSGIPVDSTNPMPVILPSSGITVVNQVTGVTVTSVTNPVLVTVTGSNATLPVSIASVPTHAVTLSGTTVSGSVSISTLPSTGIVVSSTGLPVVNGTSGLHVQLFDDSNLAYDVYNPVPVEIIGEGLKVLDASGIPITASNPLPVTSTISNFPTGIVVTSGVITSLPSTGIAINGSVTVGSYTGSTIPVSLSSVPSHAVTLASTTLTSASNVQVTSLPQIVISGTTSTLPVSLSSVPTHAVTLASTTISTGSIAVTNFPTGIAVSSMPTGLVTKLIDNSGSAYTSTNPLYTNVVNTITGVSITGWTGGVVPHVIVDSIPSHAVTLASTTLTSADNVKITSLPATGITIANSMYVSGWAAGVVPHVVVDSIPSHPVTLTSTTISTGSIYVTNFPTGIAVTSVPTGLVTSLIDSSGSYFTENNPVPVEIISDGISLLDVNGIPVDTTHPMPVILPTGTVITNPVTGVAITGITTTLPVSVPTGLSTILYDSTGSAYTNSNPIPSKITNLPTTIGISTLPSTGIAISTTGLPIYNATSGIHVQLYDDANLAYDVYNPLPVEVIGEGIKLLDSTGINYGSGNPIPVSVLSGGMSFPSSGLTIGAYSGSTIPVSLASVPSHAVTLASTTLTSASNVQVTALPQVVISGSASTIPVSISSVPSHAVTLSSTTLTSADNVKVTSLPQVVISGSSATLPVSLTSTTITSLPTSGINIPTAEDSPLWVRIASGTAGVPIFNGTASLKTSIVDELGNDYTSDNPVPVIFPNGLTLTSSDGTDITNANPLPIREGGSSYTSSAVTVTTSAAKIGSVTRLKGDIYNSGSGTIYLGGSAVTSSNGYPLDTGKSYTIQSSDIYAIMSTGTGTLRVIELLK